MPKAKGKLWGIIEEIKDCKPVRFGDGTKYQIKLLGVTKLLWVLQDHLSTDVHKNYQADDSLAKNARAQVNRGYVVEQKKFIAQEVCAI